MRVSGPAVPDLQRRLVRAKSGLRPRVATCATVLDERGGVLDRALAIRFAAPHSYTGDEMLELQIHGSPILARELIRTLLACGTRLATPGEFTQRAFFNGKIDLHAAAAVADVIDAETRAAARAAIANLASGLADEVGALRRLLGETLEELAAAIDFPDEVPEPGRKRLADKLGPVRAALERIRRDGELGRLIREGLTVAIVGPPNAGKSSLLNALLGAERAIVSEIPGTTRDTIEETAVVDGVPIRLIDTAGIREHADRLEAAGIERTERVLDAARVALVVIDGSRPISADATQMLQRTRERERIVLLNKADLGTTGARELDDPAAIVGSVRDDGTVAEVRRAIAAVGWGGETIDVARPHLASLHEFEAVNAAIDALDRAHEILRSEEALDFVATELHHAFSALGHVSEPVAAEEVLDGIFSRFCIGK
ncbi:MAG: tRNA uridine-5-carboxymethylaminomethyl(34) synthesis GTPase MnmE [Candidatus Eremiobacteraeota bacterium]|nr:tRNA uridine-5-carboxymethylaminomethyl(34) synthesis GTPase MnmE [Candidatus Eremiobacteraeota bacterium]